MEGSLKYNVDPYNEFSEEAVEQVLSEIGFFETLTTTAGKSDANHPNQNDRITAPLIDKSADEIDQGFKCSKIHSSILSLGQRQLLFVAKVVLRKPKIVLLDEATSSIDEKTDFHIQNILRKALKTSTLLTIAHRLKTIVDYDKIFVLAKGRIREQGSFQELMGNPEGIFRRYAIEEGITVKG